MGGGDKFPEHKNSPASSMHDDYFQVAFNLAHPTSHKHSTMKQSQPVPIFPLRVITHNIRYATKSPNSDERPWSERLPNMGRQLYHYTALPFNPPTTVICLQEVLHSQLKDLNHCLNNVWRSPREDTKKLAWSYVGVGRDDGEAKGEFNPIFYRPDIWKKLHFQTIWLSDTPEKVSRGWDGACNRICTCLVLQSLNLQSDENRKIMILNTHLDHAGPKARQNGAKLIIEYARKWQKQFQPDHFVLTGDLNSTKDEKGGAWEVLNGQGSGFVDSTRLLEESYAESKSSEMRHFGGMTTFTGFNGKGDGDEAGIIDFVHYGLEEDESIEQAQQKLHAHTVVPNVFGKGIRCSDHRAVIVDFSL